MIKVKTAIDWILMFYNENPNMTKDELIDIINKAKLVERDTIIAAFDLSRKSMGFIETGKEFYYRVHADK